MDVRMLKRLFQAATVGTSMLSCLTSFAGDHRLFRDEPQRPHVSAACQPNWGYNQTCWQRFPQLPPCDGQSGCLSGQCETNSMYVPQNLQPQMMHPQVMPTQSLHPEMMPNSYPMAPGTGSPSIPMMPSTMTPSMDSGVQWSSPPAMQQIPSGVSPVPAVPDHSMRYAAPQSSPGSTFQESLQPPQTFQAPGSVPALPPLPEPAPRMDPPQSQVPAIPSQSSTGPRPRDYRTVRPIQITPASKATVPGNASRYGQPSASTTPMLTQPHAVDNNTARLVASSRQAQSMTTMPMQSPSSANQNAPAMRYTSGTTTAPVAPATSTRYSGKTNSQPSASTIPVRTSSQSRPMPTQPLPESSRYVQRQ
jgi:hypothetical protein